MLTTFLRQNFLNKKRERRGRDSHKFTMDQTWLYESLFSTDYSKFKQTRPKSELGECTTGFHSSGAWKRDCRQSFFFLFFFFWRGLSTELIIDEAHRGAMFDAEVYTWQVVHDNIKDENKEPKVNRRYEWTRKFMTDSGFKFVWQNMPFLPCFTVNQIYTWNLADRVPQTQRIWRNLVQQWSIRIQRRRVSTCW